MEVDRFALLTLLEAFALAATIRISLESGERPPGSRALRALTHAAWLLPLIVILNLTLGMYLAGTLSPWPPAAFTAQAARHGFWAGAAAFVAVLTADLWLLWTPAQVLRRFAGAEQRPSLRLYRVFNLLAGGLFIALAWGL